LRESNLQVLGHASFTVYAEITCGLIIILCSVKLAINFKIN
jgi:hypothetical protein